MKGWVCQSLAALTHGHRFTLGIAWQPSQAQHCQPHPKSRHWGETNAPEASFSTETVATLLSLCEPNSPPPAPMTPSSVSIPAFRPARWGWICSSSNSATHHSMQLLLLTASATEIFRGLKQSHGPQLLAGAAPKWQGRAELLSPYTTDMPAQPFVMWWYFRHIPTSASSSATEHDGGLKQTAEKTGVRGRKGLPSPAHRLGTDWFCGILFLCFFILLAWQTALSLGLHRSSQVLQLLNLCVPCILTLKWQTGYNPEMVLHLLNN